MTVIQSDSASLSISCINQLRKLHLLILVTTNVSNTTVLFGIMFSIGKLQILQMELIIIQVGSPWLKLSGGKAASVGCVCVLPRCLAWRLLGRILYHDQLSPGPTCHGKVQHFWDGDNHKNNNLQLGGDAVIYNFSYLQLIISQTWSKTTINQTPVHDSGVSCEMISLGYFT